jgi:hypothetical protein
VCLFVSYWLLSINLLKNKHVYARNPQKDCDFMVSYLFTFFDCFNQLLVVGCIFVSLEKQRQILQKQRQILKHFAKTKTNIETFCKNKDNIETFCKIKNNIETSYKHILLACQFKEIKLFFYRRKLEMTNTPLVNTMR